MGRGNIPLGKPLLRLFLLGGGGMEWQEDEDEKKKLFEVVPLRGVSPPNPML